MRRMSFNSESGVVLPMVLIFMIALTIVGLALLHATVLEHKLTTREVYRNQAFFLADAGIDHFTYKLYRWETPMLIDWTPLGDGRYKVEADYGASPRYAESTGQRLKDGELKAEQKIRVNIQEESIFFHAVFADESLKMTGVSFVDGDIGTNSIEDGAITLTPAATVTGSADVGPGGDPSTVISGEVNINGILSALSEPRPMNPYPLPPELIPPPPLIDSGPLLVPGGDVQNIPGGPVLGPPVYYYYSEITVNGVLNINGPVTILVDRLRTQGGGGAGLININVKHPDSVVFYVTDEATLAGSGIVNVNEALGEEQDARTLYIYGTETCSSISFSGSRDLVAAVYAPEADISCTGDAYLFGSVIGNTIEIKGNPEVVYDPKLGGPTVASFFVLRDWRQVF